MEMIKRKFGITPDGAVYVLSENGEMEYLFDGQTSSWDILEELMREIGVEYSVKEI